MPQHKFALSAGYPVSWGNTADLGIPSKLRYTQNVRVFFLAFERLALKQCPDTQRCYSNWIKHPFLPPAPLQLQLCPRTNPHPTHQSSLCPRYQGMAQMTKRTESFCSLISATALNSVSLSTLSLLLTHCIITKPYSLQSLNHHFLLNFKFLFKECSSKHRFTR